VPNELLIVSGLSVSFDGFKVLDSLSLSIEHGELRFLIGPNGAGKTTLMDVISGKVRASSGRVIFDRVPGMGAAGAAGSIDRAVAAGTIADGVDLTRMSEDEIVRAGIARKFQTPSVFGSLSCYENVEVAAGFRDSLFRLFRRRGGTRRMLTRQALETVGLLDRRDVLASALSHGERQWLEIAMLLVQEPALLLLDEPVAGMTRPERERTGELLHALEGNHSLIVTEHDMDFVRQISRKVTVLHQGAVLREGSVDEIQRDPVVQEVYMGRSMHEALAAAV
jgi:urea transport system ATP-binding protein